MTVLAALDRARGAFLREVVRTPLLGGAIRDRERRISLRIGAAIAVAFALALVAPAATLAISPLVLGVPHIASSIRYLVLRQKLPRTWLAAIVIAAVTMAGLRIAEQYVGPPHVYARLEVGVASAWALGAATFGVGRRRIVAIAAIVLAGAIALAHPTLARLAFVHVHNLGALVVWLVLSRQKRALLVGVAFGVLAILLFGSIAPLWPRALGVDIETVGRWLVPGAAMTLAIPLVLAHVFTDSIHYAFWLGIIPEESLRNEGTLTFKMTWRSLRKDFGSAGLAAIIVFAFAFAVLAMFGLARARDAYFAIAGFHGYVEGVMLIYLLTAPRTGEGESERPARARSLPRTRESLGPS